MTPEAKLQLLRAIVDSGDSDETLAAYLSIAAEKILYTAFPYVKDRSSLTVPPMYDTLQVEVACYLLNRRGAEGETQHIENGVHRNYGSSDVPPDLMKRIVPHIGVVGE